MPARPDPSDRVSVDELNALTVDLTSQLAEIDRLVALRKERRRQQDLLAGITDEDRARLNAERDAGVEPLTAKLRAENDALDAELNRRRTLRVVN